MFRRKFRLLDAVTRVKQANQFEVHPRNKKEEKDLKYEVQQKG